eukprot:gene6433-4630_t
MTSNIETIKADEFTREEMTTVHRQLVLLRLQMKYKNNQDRVLSKDQVLQAWYYVTEQEEKTFLMQRKLEEFESVFSGQRKLEDMERQVEKTYESLAPTFEKLAKFNEIKTAQKNRRAFMKSTKSFRAKATINQEYSQKILDLEKSVRHIERMNEKKVRLHKAPVLQSVHRINSMKKDSSPNLLSQRSSFVDELKREEPKEMVTPEKVVLVPPKPVAVAVAAAAAPAVASPAPVPPVPKKPKQIKHVDNPLRPPEKEEVTLRKVDEAALALAKAAQTTAAAQSTQEMLQAKDNLRSTTIEASAVEPSQVPTATEFQQVQLNRTEKDDAATKKASSTEDAAQRREALLEMAKTSLRHLETPVEEVKEPPEEPAAMQVQLRKVEIVAPVVEKDTENDKNVLAVTKESLRKVASRDDDVASSAAVEIVLSTSQAAGNANDDDDADVGVDASALLENMEEDEVSSSVKVETPAAAPPSYAESTGSEKAPGASGRSLLGRSNSENSRQSAAQFPSQPVSHASSFYKASAVRSNAAAYDDNDVASVTSTLSSHTSTPPPPPQQQQQQPPKDVSHSSSAADMSTPQRTASLDIEHLKDSLRPTPMRDASLRNNNNSNNSNSSNNNDTEDVDAVPIMRMKEHLNPVVINQDKSREEDSNNGWAAPILQAKETLRPISVREKELHVKDPAAFATSETIVETQTSDAAQSPNVVKEATPPPATEFERKASVFGKLVRKVSGIMNQATAAALSPAYAERMQQNQTGGGGGGGGADGGGAALFELAMHADAQAAEEDHSASRNKIRNSNSNSNSNKNPSTPSRSATKSGSDVQVVSLTKANLERTLSLRAESADSNGPGVSFRGSFSNGHKKLSFADEPSTPATTAAATVAAAAATTPTTAMSPAQASRVTTTVALTPEALERHKANTSPTPPISGSETESVIKKKKSGMNFMKGLRKRTSSIFGSKSGSQFEINTTNMETASNVSAASTPVAAAAALTPTQRQISDTGSVSDAGFDDSASQTDNNNNKQLRKKSGGFSSFMRSTSSVFRRSKSGNVYGNTGPAAANDGVIPEDEEMDFSETLSPTGAQSVSQQNVFAVEENDADETGSQMTANSEQKKKRLSMKGLMKRTSSLFKK